MEHQLRIHLREQATRDVIGRTEREAGALSNTREVGVCFVDLSGFTRLGERVPVEQVGALGARMAELCMEVAQPPVELVKTIGDGGMFVSADVDALLDAACALAQSVEQEGEELPAMRAGVAFGPAVVRLGDWFGATVNRASHIVDIAKPRTIVADGAARERSTRRARMEAHAAQEPQGHRRTEPAALPARPARWRGVLTGRACRRRALLTG